jgi:hypothetical protein
MKATNWNHAQYGHDIDCVAHVMQTERTVQMVVQRDDGRKMRLTLTAVDAEMLARSLHNAAELARLVP